MIVRRKSEKNTYGLPRGQAIRRELRAWFGAQRRAVAAYVETGRIEAKDETGGELPASVPGFDAFGLGSLPMSERMVPLIEAIWEDAGQSFNARLGLDPDNFSVTNPNTRSAIDRAALDFCEVTNATTHMELTQALEATRAALAEGLIARGDSVADLTRRVNDIFSAAETWRARNIAVTEASRAVHAAQEMSAFQSGVVTGWRLLLSEDACPRCQVIYRRAPAVRLGQPFAIIGDHPVYSIVKYPPLHNQCQCTVEEILDVDRQPQWAATLVDPQPEEQDLPPEDQRGKSHVPYRVKRPAPLKRKASARLQP